MEIFRSKIISMANILVAFYLEFCSSRPDGIYPDPDTCKGFIHCHNNRTARKNCPAGTLFNPKLKVCDWPHNVDCPTGRYKGRSGRTSKVGNWASDFKLRWLTTVGRWFESTGRALENPWIFKAIANLKFHYHWIHKFWTSMAQNLSNFTRDSTRSQN